MGDPGGFNVRHADIEATLRDLGRRIKSRLPQGWGFTLLIYSYGKTGIPGEGPAGSLFYIASGDREDTIKSMEEFIRKNRH